MPVRRSRGTRRKQTQKTGTAQPRLKRGASIPIKTGAYKPPLRQGSYKDIGLSSKRVLISPNTKLYHVSTYEKLKAFTPARTCFSTNESQLMRGHVYMFETLKPIHGEQVDSTEIRLDLGEINPSAIHITYLGEIHGGNKFLVDNDGRTKHRFLSAKFAPKYKTLAKQIETNDREQWENAIKKYNYKIITKPRSN